MRFLWMVLAFLFLTVPTWAQEVQASYTVAGMRLDPAGTTYRNNMQGQLTLPFANGTQVPMTFQLQPDGGKVVSGFVTSKFALTVNGFTFHIQDAIYDATQDRFVGDGTVTGQDVPDRVLAKGVVLSAKGVEKVGTLTIQGWGTAGELWNVAQGELTPDGLAWVDDDIEVKGLFLQGIFHGKMAARVDDGRVASVSLVEPTVLLQEHRLVRITGLRLQGQKLLATGETGLPDGSRHFFKDVVLQNDGTLATQFPVYGKGRQSGPRWATPDEIAKLKMQVAAGNGVEGIGRLVTGWEPSKEELFAPSEALEVAQAQGLAILNVQGAPNLQLVVTQRSGNTVDGFIPLMDWVGQVNVYGATVSGTTATVDNATMNWLKKEAQVPASGFGIVQLQDPVTLNPATGRLTSGLVGNPSFRGFSANLSAWEVDTKEFRMRAGLFGAVNAKANPMGPGALFQAGLNFTDGGANVQGAPSIPPDVQMPDRYGAINAQYQGGAEFDIVFLQGGDWGFEFRTAMPSLSIGGPDWMRSGTAYAPKGVKWPSIFLKVYNSGFVYFNFVGQGIQIPLGDSGVALNNPGLLFGYEPLTQVFFMEVSCQAVIVDVNPNIFAAQGRLYIDGSGMGKSGGGEVQLAGYVLDINVSEFDVGFGKNGEEWMFALTVPVFDILGFSLECNGEFKVHAPSDDWVGAVSGFIRIPLIGKLGATFYGYLNPFRVHFSFGGHEFHIAGGDSNSPTYQGDFQLMGLNWNGTETVNTSAGSVNAAGKSTVTGTASDKSTLSGTLQLQNVVVSEEGVARGTMTGTNFAISLNPSGSTVAVTGKSPSFTLDGANNRFTTTFADVPAKVGNFNGKADLEVDLSATGIVTATLDLPDSAGGPYTQQFNVTSTAAQ